jgi:hypothetical protein
MKTEQQIRDVMSMTIKAKSLVKTVVKNKKERILAETMYENKIRTFNWILGNPPPEDVTFHICQHCKIVYFGSGCPICKNNHLVPTLTKEMINPPKKTEAKHD